MTQEKIKLSLLLKQLRLPTIGTLWEDISNQADQEGWGSARCLSILCEHELTERANRRMNKYWKESCLPAGKTFSSFDFKTVPLNKTMVLTLASGEGWLKQGRNILIFGPSGVGKTHLAAAIGSHLLENRARVLFTRTTTLIQKLQIAKQGLTLSSALEKLNKYECIILDDFGYANKDMMETNVLFELISERYERKSLIITCNQPFGEWNHIFQDKAMAIAAIDRLVHDAKILQINKESYRKNSLIERNPSQKPTKKEQELL